MLFYRRIPFRLRCLGVILVVLGLFAVLYGRTTLETSAYLFRPIWDSPGTPWTIIPQYYAEGISGADVCVANSWSWRNEGDRVPKVFDAIIFSVELDLLEIRLRELLPVVDKFLILEAESTFTGLPKPLVFQQNQERFSFAANKIVHRVTTLPHLEKGEDPFKVEAAMRVAMNDLLREVNVEEGDWVIMSDVDEIPARHTIGLLANCTGIPSPLHLQLRSYIYSFEFPYGNGMDSWRAQLHRYEPSSTYYRHSRASDFLLIDAGWHCSFCFRTINDFVFKMTAYSHSDRVKHEGLLDETRIQNVICEGSDIFGMLPEAYSYREFWSKWGKLDKSASAVHLPQHLIAKKDRFRFLLPGGCMRNDSTDL
ncbi:beta-1,4-mannosyl-glycoprotein 4-beta-N-acetylglucosaminyltransferase [Spizellomyces sp. 'palustris']|nr:beta-1,4-mannosyl-glycoprotein 4-beta-N-acetylglucosaminyltransferase [Spizellomyces sp. 'palustris']